MSQFPNIYFVCVHKGASTFIARNLFPSLAKRNSDFKLFNVGLEYVDWFHANSERLKLEPTSDQDEMTRRLKLMFAERAMPETNGLIGRLYTNQIEAICQHLQDDFPPRKSRAFIMRRDPRDALVSMYYSRAFSHSEKSMLTVVASDKLDQRRNNMRKMGVYKWIEQLLVNPKSQEIIEEFSRCALVLEQRPDVIDLPYEQLINEPRQWLEAFVSHSGFESIVDDQWFDEMCENLKPPVEIDNFQHKRRVKPGNWKEIFDNNLAEIMKNRVGSTMEQLQYQWDD